MDAPLANAVLRVITVGLNANSPSLKLIRANPGISINLLPSAAFVARARKLSDENYEISLSVGVWISLYYLISQEFSRYEEKFSRDDGECNQEPDRIETIVSFSDDCRVRIARVDEIAAHRASWRWHTAPEESTEFVLNGFIKSYLQPWVDDDAVDRRVELAVGFIVLHELWHVYQDHFRQFSDADKTRDKSIEMLADLRAACMFPGLIDHCAMEFSIGGRRRCNQLIASGFSIGCALLCFQMLQIGRSSQSHPDPLTRLMSLMLHFSHNAMPRDISEEDRGQLLAGMYLILDSFSALEEAPGPANREKVAAEIAAIGKLRELDDFFNEHPSPYFLKYMGEHTASEASPLAIKAFAIKRAIGFLSPFA